MTAEQASPHPGMPGREAEDMPGIGSSQPSPDPDRNLTPSGAGEGPGARPQGDQSDAREVEEDLAELLADAEQKRDEYLDVAKRTQADFENYRKRMAAEVQAASLRGKGAMARELIEAVDNLERALASAGESPDGLAGGVEMVLRGMREALNRNGVAEVDPKGEKFDPTQHEALSTMPVDGAEAGIVVEVMQKGYRLDDQLLRPARVVVSA